jgi:hypothetical protein
MGAWAARCRKAATNMLITHEEWRYGQRVMLSCWLAGVEKAAYLGHVSLSERNGAWLRVFPNTVLKGTPRVNPLPTNV